MLFAPLFAPAMMSLVSDSPSSEHPSASQRRDMLMSAFPEEWGRLLGAKQEWVLAEIDPDLFEILDANSRGLFEVYSASSEYVQEMGHRFRNVAVHDLKSMLAKG